MTSKTIALIFLLIFVLVVVILLIKFIKDKKIINSILSVIAILVAIIIAIITMWPENTETPSAGTTDAQSTAEYVTDTSEISNPSTNETEPNDSFSEAKKIPSNNTISGTFEGSEDLDCYYFTTDNKISFEINLTHDLSDSDNNFCSISVYSKSNTEEPLYEEVISEKDTDFTTSKIRVPKGSYYILLTPRYYDDSDKNYKFIVTTTSENSEFESEPNNKIEEAKSNNIISLNSQVTGNLQSSDDVDYYYFSVTNPGKINVTFTHDKIDESGTVWSMELITENNDEAVISKDIKGSETTTKSDTINVSPNSQDNFYLKIYSNYNHHASDYKIQVNFTEFSEVTTQKNGSYSYDKEPNNDIQTATPISLNKKIEGNIQSEDDLDYYKFTVNKDGKLNISFSHPFIDRNNTSWSLYVLSESSPDNLLEFDVDQNMATTKSDTIRISKGTYYLKIEPSYDYNNDSYTFKINFS